MICTHCRQPITEPTVRLEGVVIEPSNDWAWGPFPVHVTCRPLWATPYDEQVGDGVHVLAWEDIPNPDRSS